MSEEEVGGWVWPSNVRPLLTYISLYAGYSFDDLDWQAIETALLHTDADDPASFYEYPLVGRTELVVRLAQNVGADPVAVRVSGSMDLVLKTRVETLLSILAEVEDAPQG